jgi:hypothetical protein
MIGRHRNTVMGASQTVVSRDGTKIGYLSMGGGPLDTSGSKERPRGKSPRRSATTF